MNWRKAKHRTWRLAVIWDAGDEPPEKPAAAAETVRQVTVVVHRHLHLTHGGDAAALGLALPPGGATARKEE